MPKLKNIIKKALFPAIVGVLVVSAVAGAAILGGFQGGTGFGTGNLGNAAVGLNLQVASTSPFLTYTFAGGSGITSLNGSTSSTQTFATSGTPILNISTANGVHTFNLSASSSWGLVTSVSGSGNIGSSGGLSPVVFFTGVLPYASSTHGAILALSPLSASTDAFGTTTVSFSGVIPVASTSLGVRGNLTLTGNILNTAQDIVTTSSPTFASTTLTSNLYLNNWLYFVSSTPPVPTDPNSVIVHAHPFNGLLELHVHSIWTQNGCDDLTSDNCLPVKNNSGGALTLGQVVYINGGSGTNQLVGLAQANTTSTAKAIGLVTTSSVANNGFLFVMQSGELDNLNTSAFAVGDPVYLSPTVAGGLTNTRPTVPNLVERIGTVVRSHASLGAINVSVAPAVLGQETGTINPTFNINGANAVTTSTEQNDLVQGAGINISTNSAGSSTFTNGFTTSSISINLYSPTSTAPNNYAKVLVPYNATVTKVLCDEYVTSTTVGVTLYNVTSDASIQNAGNIVPLISCSTTATSTTSFSTSSIVANNYILAVVTSTTGAPLWTTVHIILNKL